MVTNLSFLYCHNHENVVGEEAVEIAYKTMEILNNSEEANNTTCMHILYDVKYQDSITVSASVTLWLWKIFPLFLLTFGTPGNVMTVIVLLRQNLRSNSTTLYLLVLAITDLVVLYFGLLRQYLRKVHDEDFRVSMGCGFHLWLVYTSVAYSSWLLVALTMDRYVSIKFPVYVRNRNSRRCAIIVLVFLFIILASVNSHFLFSWESREYTYKTKNMTITYCETSSSSYDYLHEHIWPWVDLCIFSIIPFILLGIGNCSIGHNLLVRERSKRLQHPCKRVKDKNSSVSQKRSATKLLIILSAIFFITTLPASLYIVIISFNHSTDNETIERFNLFWAIASFFMYTNNAINFVLYCVSATNFRHEFKDMVKEFWQWTRKVWTQMCVCQEENHSLKRFVDSLHGNARKQSKVRPTSADMETALNISTVASALNDGQSDKKKEVFVTAKTEPPEPTRSKCYTEIEMFTLGVFKKQRNVSFSDEAISESKDI